MAESPNTKIIAPVVYENHLSKIAAAFAKGCGGVIVDGIVPDSLSAEISALRLSPEQQGGVLKNYFHIACRNGDMRELGWRDQDKDFPLPETERWLAEEIKGLMAAGLCQGFNKVTEMQKLMTVWLNDAVAIQWHTDRQKSVTRPDMHLHIHGEGLLVASPQREIRLRMKKTSSAYVLSSNALSMQGSRAAILPDQMLEQRGVQLIRLQPGQKLFFRDRCLHRSSVSPPDQVKLRAAMF